jgi:hypothetical protein
MSLHADAAVIAAAAAEVAAGELVTYCRGSGDDAVEADITAVIGSQVIQSVTQFENLILKRHKESFIVNRIDLAAAELGEPQAEDTIKYTPPGRPDVVLTFAVRPDEQGQPCYRPTDRFHTRWRLSTFLTAVEAVDS